MNDRVYGLISGMIFAVVALMHFLRIMNQWTVVLGPWTVPLWASWVGLAASGLLSVWGFLIGGKKV